MRILCHRSLVNKGRRGATTIIRLANDVVDELSVLEFWRLEAEWSDFCDTRSYHNGTWVKIPWETAHCLNKVLILDVGFVDQLLNPGTGCCWTINTTKVDKAYVDINMWIVAEDICGMRQDTCVLGAFKVNMHHSLWYLWVLLFATWSLKSYGVWRKTISVKRTLVPNHEPFGLAQWLNFNELQQNTGFRGCLDKGHFWCCRH